MKNRAKHFAEVWKTIQLVNKTIQKCINWSQRKNELPAQSTDEMI